MAKYKDGEFIELCWEDYIESFYIKGHIPFDEARKIMDLQIGVQGDDYTLAEPTHIYARWECNAWSEHDHCLQAYPTTGKGKFKVTEFKVIRK